MKHRVDPPLTPNVKMQPKMRVQIITMRRRRRKRKKKLKKKKKTNRTFVKIIGASTKEFGLNRITQSGAII